MSNIQNSLKSLGLLDSEIRTYLAALELGPSTVIDIANKTKLSRQAVYTSIDKLIAEGLMSSVEKGKKSLYSTESPERLLSYAQSKLKRMEATVREIKDASEDLKLLQKGEKPVVRMFEGKEGYLAIMNDMIKSKPERIYNFANEANVENVFTEDELLPYKTQLDKLDIRSDFISIAQKPHTYRRSTRHKAITRKDLYFDGDVLLYKDRIILNTWQGKMISIIVENKILSETLQVLFKLAWENDNK